MRPKHGQQYKVKWIDAFGDSTWADDKELDKLIKEHSRPENQTLYLLNNQTSFISSHPASLTSATHTSTFTAYQRVG
jgi:hypothetical protein